MRRDFAEAIAAQHAVRIAAELRSSGVGDPQAEREAIAWSIERWGSSLTRAAVRRIRRQLRDARPGAEVSRV